MEKQKRQNQKSWAYQDQERGGICMMNVEIMIKALRLAWIPRLLTPEKKKLENDSTLLPKKNWRFELSIKM